MDRGGPDRDWSLVDAAYRDAEGAAICVLCGKYGAQMAHIIGREHDKNRPLFWHWPELVWRPYIVVPDRIIPLCGPVPSAESCHGRYDGPDHKRGDLDILPHLTLNQQLQATADARNISRALRRISGPALADTIAARLPPVRLPRHLV